MMINCDYCGANIDIKKHKVCPHCGATYEDNVEYKAHKAQEKELNKIKLQREVYKRENDFIEHDRKQQNYNYINKINKIGNVLKILYIIPVICFICCCLFSSITNIYNEFYTEDTKNNTNTEAQIQEEVETEVIIEESKTGGFNETISTSTYSVTITELKAANAPWHWKPEEGYMYIAFYVEVENISDKEILSDEHIYCTVDGVMVDKFLYSEDKYIKDANIPKGMKIAGYTCFEVPIDSTEFVLTYGDYLTFTIPNTLNPANQIEKVTTPISVNLNEPAQLSNFKVTATELKNVDKGNWLAAKEGYMYVGVNIEVENISNKTLELASEEIYLLADDILAEEFIYGEEKELTKTKVPAGMKINGYICYEVPINANNFTIKYGDYIIINIPNTLKN